VIFGGLGRILIAKSLRPRRPATAEAREIVIDVKHDGGDTEQCRFFDDPAQ
jgi:hypothetical protein